MSALSPRQQPTVLFSIYQNNTWTIIRLVDETIDPAIQHIILKIVGFSDLWLPQLLQLKSWVLKILALKLIRILQFTRVSYCEPKWRCCWCQRSYNREDKNHKKETPTFQKSLECTPKDDFVHVLCAKKTTMRSGWKRVKLFETTLFMYGPLHYWTVKWTRGEMKNESYWK